MYSMIHCVSETKKRLLCVLTDGWWPAVLLLLLLVRLLLYIYIYLVYFICQGMFGLRGALTLFVGRRLRERGWRVLTITGLQQPASSLGSHARWGNSITFEDFFFVFVGKLNYLKKYVFCVFRKFPFFFPLRIRVVYKSLR